MSAIQICRADVQQGGVDNYFQKLLMLYGAKAVFITALEVERPAGKADTLVGGSSQACLCIKPTPVSPAVPPSSQAFLRFLPPPNCFSF